MLTTPLVVRGPLLFHAHLGWDRYFAWLHVRQRWEITVHLPFTASSRRYSLLGAASTPKLESPAEFLSLQFFLITLVKGDSVLPLKIRVWEKTLSNW